MNYYILPDNLATLYTIELRRIASEFKVNWRKGVNNKPMRRKELYYAIRSSPKYIAFVNSLQSNIFTVDLSTKLLPPVNYLKVEELFNKYSLCNYFGYSLHDFITLEKLKCKLLNLYNSNTINVRILTSIYKSVKDNIIWLQNKSYNPTNLIVSDSNKMVYSTLTNRVDHDILSTFYLDTVDLVYIKSLGLTINLPQESIPSYYKETVSSDLVKLNNLIDKLDYLENKLNTTKVVDTQNLEKRKTKYAELQRLISRLQPRG